MLKKVFSAFLACLIGATLSVGIFSVTGMESHAAGTGAVSIGSVRIAGSNVVIQASASDLPDSDDGVYYLFSEKVYQAGPAGNAVATAPVGPNATFQVPLAENTAECRLYDKFQIAVKQGGALVPVTGGHYITNPEALAGGSPGRKNNGKKGLILDGAKMGNGEAAQLGVQQGAYNINLEDVIGGNGQVTWGYNGKNYQFDSAAVGMYDKVVKSSTEQGMGLTMVLLNPRAKGEEFMIAPAARGGRCNYYMMNTSEQKGLEYLEAVVAFLANRYNGRNGVGQVDNWVIGNEVNAKTVWNYCNIADEMAYAQQYANSVRVCYNAIKSKHANAYVCISVDQNWTKIHNASYYSARSMIEAVNYCLISEGNIDWCVAEHPYNYPMNWTSFWTPQSATAAAMSTHGIDTPYLTMQNIEQLSAYMSQQALRNTKGEVRPILLTEVGYSSTQGEEAQAAAIVYAYQRALSDPNIKMIIFNRQTDHANEVKQGLAVGLTRPDGSHKLAFEFFQQMSGPNAGAYIQRANAYMGISN
ncbi:MAG: hypothetical protein K6G16_09420 [Lachnospiraceae bacterium]|nr:hypothetical protein [Lachnospiraceae bacterium]